MSVPDRRAKLDRAHGVLSIRHQCRLLGLSRSGVYRTPQPANDDDLTLMRQIDELFTARPFLGSRRMAWLQSEDGVTVRTASRISAPKTAQPCSLPLILRSPHL